MRKKLEPQVLPRGSFPLVHAAEKTEVSFTPRQVPEARKPSVTSSPFWSSSSRPSFGPSSSRSSWQPSSWQRASSWPQSLLLKRVLVISRLTHQTNSQPHHRLKTSYRIRGSPGQLAFHF